MDRIETYTWKVVRTVVGLPPMALALKVIAREDWIVQTGEVKGLGVVTFVGALLFVSGLVGILRLRRDRRAESPPERTLAGKAAWLLAAVVIAAGLAAGAVFAARVANVVLAERYQWEHQEAMSDEGQAGKPKSYLHFIASFHPGVAQELVDDADRAREGRSPGLLTLEKTRLFESERSRYTIGHYEGWIGYLRDQADSPWGADTDASWYLETFTPAREHLAAAKDAYDDARFADAVAEGNATALRIYRYQFANVGRHVEDAREALSALYGKAEERYAALIADRKTEAGSVAGIRALLAHLREQDVDSFIVPVCFLPVEGLAGEAIEQAIREETGAKKIVPVSPAFTAKLNETRHGGVVSRMDEALRAVVGDLFRLEPGEVEQTRDRARFLVHYRVFGTGRIYTSRSEDALPVAERTLFVGVAIAFGCTIQVPEGDAPLSDDPEAGHAFGLVAEPAMNFKAGRSDLPPEQNAAAVYGTMASTAFDDFQRSLVVSYGLGEAEPEGGENEGGD